MHIVHVIAGVWQHTGGPAEVVPKMCQTLVELGCRVTLMTLDGPHSEAALECAKRGVDFRSYPVLGRRGIWYSPALARALHHIADEADIIHNNGLWLHPNWAAGYVAAKLNKPLFITPHGLLGHHHLRRSWFKKRLAWYLFDSRNVARATCMHLFVLTEVPQIRKMGIRCPLSVIPNGVGLWQLPSQHFFEQRFPQVRGKKIFLFFGRVHSTKGVFDLIEAWRTVYKKHKNWHLVIAGKPEAECVNKVEAKIKEYGLQSSATLAGPQYGQHRLEAYSAADAFVLPSYAEGFSTSILEAMACGLPVVYTIPCNFPEAAKRGAGFLGPTGVEPLVKNLDRLIKMSDSDRRKMGVIGRKLVEEKYTWPQVTKQVLRTYEWILGGGCAPCWVELV